jgi:hypothetical protein
MHAGNPQYPALNPARSFHASGATFDMRMLFCRHFNDTFYALIAGGEGAMQEAGDAFKDAVLETQGTLALMCK